MRILTVTDYLPYPPISGDSIRVYNLVRRVAEKHEVSLLAALGTPDDAGALSHMQGFCRTVETAGLTWRSPWRLLPGLARYALTGKPPELRLLHSEEMARMIRRVLSAQDFDVVHIEQSRMALYAEAIPASSRSARVLAFQNVASDQYKRISQVERKPVKRGRALLHSLMMRRWEPHYAQRFDRCIAVSEPDRQLLLAANPHLRIDLVPNGVDTRTYRPLGSEGAERSLLFIGSMSYPPCVDAITYFCQAVLPRVRRVLGQIGVWVVGADPSPEVLRLAGDGVHVTGRVQDVVPYYRRSAVAIVPLRAGGGTRLKVLEAMALGRPVVSTSIGSEGLDVTDGQHLLVADRADRFADCIVRLLTDEVLYHEIAANARQLVVNTYDWEAIAGRLMDIYAMVKHQPDRHNGSHSEQERTGDV